MPDGRLSEDIDLIALGSRAEIAAALEQTLATGLRRSHGRIAWADTPADEPALSKPRRRPGQPHPGAAAAFHLRIGWCCRG